MENLFMSAGIVVAIVLSLVGIIKLPFNKFKTNHPKQYKALFTLISILLAVGLAIVDELYILCGKLWSIDFGILVSVVVAGVFFGYGGIYEGLGVKGLVQKIIDALKKAKEMSKNKKVVKFLNKIENVEEAINVLTERKNNENSTEV